MELSDEYFVRTTESLPQNTARFFAKGFILGGILSGYHLEAAFRTQPFWAVAGRSIFGYALPLGAAGAIFASTTALLDSKRGMKSSNAAVGGALAGFFYTCRNPLPWKCLKATLVVGALAGALRFVITCGPYVNPAVENTEVQELKDAVYMHRIAHLGPQVTRN